MADLGDGAYMVNPKVAGFTNITKIIDDKSDVFLQVKYTNNAKREISIVTTKGVDL